MSDHEILSKAASDLLSDAAEWRVMSDYLRSLNASLRGTVVFMDEPSVAAQEITGTIYLLAWVIDYAKGREASVRALGNSLSLIALGSPEPQQEPSEEDRPSIH